MKKVVVIIIAVTVIITGCSSVKKPVNDTTTKYTTASSNQKSQSQQDIKLQSDENTNSNTGSSTVNSIDTAKSPFEKGYYNYQGSISNNMPIQMSIYPLGKDIVGSYFYDSQRKEIKLEGKAGDKDIVLYEFDETGKNTGMFKGTMNTADKIEGTWISKDNETSYPFTLALKSITPGAEYGKRYSVAVGTVSDQAVESFADKIQSNLVSNDKKQLAQQVKYPITVKIDDKAVKIINEAEFIKNYDKIFNNDFKKAISSDSTKYMFVNFQGIMLGTGLYNIWINEVTLAGGNSKLMIIAINN